MSEADFFSEAMREAVGLAIQKVESQTSAELVVNVSRKSDTYRDIDYLAGSLAAFACLLILLFHPVEFTLGSMPFFVLLAYFAGAVVIAGNWPIKRRCLSRQRRQDAVHKRAAQAFIEQGIGRTAAHTGILVYVSICERSVVAIADKGVKRELLEAGLQDMERALIQGVDPKAFLEALQALGPVLGKVLPRQDDDVNELSDQLVQA